MVQPQKHIPELGLLPDYGQFFPPPRSGSYTYFDLASNDFFFNINDPLPSPVRAWIMAECSLLVYEEPDFIEQVLSQSNVFGKHSFHWLQASNEHENQGVAGFLIEAETFVLMVFRGTEFYRLEDISRSLSRLKSVWLDLITDMKIKPKIQTKTPPYFDTAIHSGFYDALKSLWKPITNLLGNTSNKPLWLTGHSLGAALATLTACQFPEQLAGLYTFGSPCVGTVEFVKAYKNKNLDNKTFRYVLGNDAIHKTLAGFAGYQHVGAIEHKYSGRSKTFIESLWNKFIPLDLIDHAPLCYAIKAWNEIT